MTLRVNYDAAAAGYDRRAEIGHYLQGSTAAVFDLAAQIDARHALDLGCGTGRSLIGLTGSVTGFGLDFSAGMLTRAAALGPQFRLVQASAPQPPFAAGSFDLVISMMAFHHFPLKTQTIREAYRLLRPGGALAIANIDLHADSTRWFVYDWFPQTRPLDEARFPAAGWYESQLQAAGFEQIDNPVVERVHEIVTGPDIWQNYWLQKNSCSQLILLPDADYRAGLRRIESALRQNNALELETNLTIRLWHGFKPRRE
jgi:ubiquinone/menaquinone biosynthesis C-methylase UbiE